jgi:hypothetical protein
MISVKPEFRDPKKEIKDEPPAQAPPQKKVEDEGIKATMETRGPPPATPTSFGAFLHPAFMGGRSPFDPYGQNMLAGMPPNLLASLYGSNPYLPQHLAQLGFRPPFMPPTSGAEDLSRSAQAAMAMAAVSSMSGGGSSATKALDLLQQHASQYYAAAAAASGAGPTPITSSAPSSHKIHELQERALKSPVTGGRTSGTSSPSVSARSTPSSSLTTMTTTSSSTKTSTTDMLSSPSMSMLGSNRKGTPSPSSRTTPTGARSRSPPPLRHVHTHTHTHFGLGYPLLPSEVPGAPPAAHTPFPSPGFPSKIHIFKSR